MIEPVKTQVRTLIDYLVALERHHKVQLKHIARMVGVTTKTMRGWREGRASPSLEKLEAWSDVMGVEVAVIGSWRGDIPILAPPTPPWERNLEPIPELLEPETTPPTPPRLAKDVLCPGDVCKACGSTKLEPYSRVPTLATCEGCGWIGDP
jgi:transcriptional regulator with XRE-family HTH domain